jgi:hypothetical protein
VHRFVLSMLDQFGTDSQILHAIDRIEKPAFPGGAAKDDRVQPVDEVIVPRYSWCDDRAMASIAATPYGGE